MLWDWLMYEKGLAPTPMCQWLLCRRREYPIQYRWKHNAHVRPRAGQRPQQSYAIETGATQLYMREIRGDGSVPVVHLSVKRIKGEAPAPKPLDELAKEAAVLIASGVKATHMITTTFGSTFREQNCAHSHSLERECKWRKTKDVNGRGLWAR